MTAAHPARLACLVALALAAPLAHAEAPTIEQLAARLALLSSKVHQASTKPRIELPEARR